MHRRRCNLRSGGRKRRALLGALAFSCALPAFACEAYLYGRQTILDPQFSISNETVRVAFFDADDTLRTSIKRPGGFVDAVDDVAILPGVVDRIADLNARGLFVAIVSNQGGVPKYRSLQQIDEVLKRTVELLRERGAKVNYYDFAETWDEFRKPQIGMIHRLEGSLAKAYGRALVVDRHASFMVGDAAYTSEQTRPDGRPGTDRSDSDRMFAENAGLGFHEAREYFGWGTQIAP